MIVVFITGLWYETATGDKVWGKMVVMCYGGGGRKNPEKAIVKVCKLEGFPKLSNAVITKAQTAVPPFIPRRK